MEKSNPGEDGLKELQRRLDYSFKDQALLERALTHSSFAYEIKSGSEGKVAEDYESMEFLGDAILGFLISEHLFLSHPSLREGELSKIRSFLVSANHLASLSQELDLGAFLRLGRGEEKTGGRKKKALLADLFESLIAAVYLDGGFEPTRRFVLSQFSSRLKEIAEEHLDFQDRKSLLQEELHSQGFTEPTYRVVEEFGPDHSKQFVIEVNIEDKLLAKASGRSKKEAQQRAAAKALEGLEDLLDR